MCTYVSLNFYYYYFIYFLFIYLFIYYYYFIYFFLLFCFFSLSLYCILCLIVIMLWAAGIDGHLSSLVACQCTDLYLFNLFVHLANKLSHSLSLSLSQSGSTCKTRWAIRVRERRDVLLIPDDSLITCTFKL